MSSDSTDEYNVAELRAFMQRQQREQEMNGLTDTTFLRGLPRYRLREIAESIDRPEDDAQGFHIRTIQRNAARQMLAAMDEQRLERLASDQLGALVRSDFASMDHDGMAETALSLAKALAKQLDKEG